MNESVGVREWLWRDDDCRALTSTSDVKMYLTIHQLGRIEWYVLVPTILYRHHLGDHLDSYLHRVLVVCYRYLA